MNPRGRRRARPPAGGVAALLLLVWVATAGAGEIAVSASRDSVKAGADLVRAVTLAPPGSVIHLDAGVFSLAPRPYSEPTCGNCEAETTRVLATVGLTVKGRDVQLVGPLTGEAVIRTNAGYGVLFEDCRECGMKGITVTGGERDTSGKATDAAVVVKRSSVEITGCTLRDNIGDSTVVAATVVGIMGIAVREGGVLRARGNRILHNSWDGIALYRDAGAIIEGNVIDGVELARGSRIGGGRGVGIGVTWNASAKIRGNLVRRYWKGIGGFLNAQVTVEENVVENVATWGLTLWDAGKGKPAGFFADNVVYTTGACGASIIRESEDPPFPGRFIRNVLVKTGQDPRYDSGEPYCFQLPLAEHAVPASYTVAENLTYRNRTAGGGAAPEDVSEPIFKARLAELWKLHSAWPSLRDAQFWKDFPVRP
jgi:Right handed beta helix region